MSNMNENELATIANYLGVLVDNILDELKQRGCYIDKQIILIEKDDL